MADDRWISVKDRLPDLGPDGDSENLLLAVQYKQDGEHAIMDGYLETLGDGSTRWCGCDCFELHGDVTHWQPMPSVEGL